MMRAAAGVGFLGAMAAGRKKMTVVRLARGLEFMPLAIVQAAGYITHQSLRCSVSQYLE
jgi:hypothetical protein